MNEVDNLISQKERVKRNSERILALSIKAESAAIELADFLSVFGRTCEGDATLKIAFTKLGATSCIKKAIQHLTKAGDVLGGDTWQ